MYYISYQQAAGMDPGESVYTIAKDGDVLTLLADVEEDQNHDGGPGARVGLYGRYGGNWTLDRQLVLSPLDSAAGDACGRNAGGICYDFEDQGAWAHADVYDCLFDNTPEANGQVAVIEALPELYDALPDGIWHVILSTGTAL